MSTPPFCSDSCCCHEAAQRIEVLSAMVADLIQQRDAAVAEATLLATTLGSK